MKQSKMKNMILTLGIYFFAFVSGVVIGAIVYEAYKTGVYYWPRDWSGAFLKRHDEYVIQLTTPMVTIDYKLLTNEDKKKSLDNLPKFSFDIKNKSIIGIWYYVGHKTEIRYEIRENNRKHVRVGIGPNGANTIYDGYLNTNVGIKEGSEVFLLTRIRLDMPD